MGVNKAELIQRIEKEACDSRLSCKDAFALAAEMNCLPADVGACCNELKIKIDGCQLGCF